MTNTSNQQLNSLNSIEFIRDLTLETAANYSDSAVTVTDVILTSEEGNQGFVFGSNKAIEDLHDFGLNNASEFIAVNSYQT